MVSLIEKAVKELGLYAQISTQEIKNRKEAEELGFLGSPTVKVNGIDLEPQATGKTFLS
ncbi:DsbA family protein [Thermodesulfatator autotrophicus]|nr:DsbA family protein [Thermodesulfatator autotrophicus]